MNNFGNIMRIEYTNEYTENIRIEMIALFNAVKTTEEEAKEELMADTQEKIIIMTKKQFEHVFK